MKIASVAPFYFAVSAARVVAYPDLQETGGKPPCPFGRRQTEEALAQANEEAAPRIAAWEGWETSDASGEEEPLVPRLYTVGEKNDDEEFCSGDSDNKFCDKVRMVNSCGGSSLLPVFCDF